MTRETIESGGGDVRNDGMTHTNVRPELVAVGEGPQGVVLSVLAYPEAGHGLMHLGVLRIVLERLIHESLALALRILLEAAHNKEQNKNEQRGQLLRAHRV